MASGNEIKISIVSALNAAGIEATQRQVDQMAKSVNLSIKMMNSGSAESAQKVTTSFMAMAEGARLAKAHFEKGIGVSSQLAGALSSVDASASRAAQAAGGLVTAFAQGGIAGAAFAAVTMAINAKLKDMTEELERTKKEAADLEAKLNKGFSEHLASRIQNSIENARALGTEFERVAKHAEQVSLAMAGLQSAQSSGGIIALQTEKLNATIGEMDESLRKTIAAAYDVQIAEAKLAQVEQDGAAKVEAARQAYLENQKRVTMIADQIATIDAEIAVQKKTAAAISNADAQKSAEIRKQVLQLEKERAALVEKQNNAESESTALEIKWQTASQENQNAINQQTNAVKQTTESQRQLAESIEKRKREEERQLSDYIDKQVHDLEVQSTQQMLAEATKEEADARKEAARAAAAVKTAEEKLNEAIKDYEKNLYQNMVDEQIERSKNTDNGRTMTNYWGDLMKNVPMIAAATREQAIKQGIANGTIRSVDQATKVGNQAAREAAKALSKASNIAGKEAQRAARLEKMSQKAMSKVDKEWLKRYKEIEAAKKAQREAVKKREQEVKEAKQKLQKAQESQEKGWKTVEEIDKKLKALGLK